MRKKSLALTLMLAFSCILVGDLMGQTIELGSDQYTSNSFPVATKNFYHSLSEQIYTASEITGATGYTNGQIRKIYFKSESALSRKIDIYIRHTTKSSFSSNSDWIPVLSTDLRYSSGGGTVSFVANDWTEITLDTPFEYDGTSNIVVIVDDNTGEKAAALVNFKAYQITNSTYHTNYITQTSNTNIDPCTTTSGASRYYRKNHIELTFETISYPRPITPTASAITNRTASISWTAPTATSGYTLEGYQYKYTIINTNIWSSTTTTGTNSCDLESLSGGANYAFVVRAIYTDSSKETHYSDWAEVDFKTDCDAVDVDDELSWDFENSGSMPDCWTIAASYISPNYGNPTFPGPYNSSSYAHSSNYSIRFCDSNEQVILLPAITQLNGKTLKFYAKASGATGSYTITVGYYNSLGVFTSIKNDFDFSTTYPENAYEVTFNNLPNDVERIAIKGSTDSNSRYIYLDDVSIVAPVDCAPATSPTVGTVTYNSAQLSWTAGGSETNWKLQYRASGAGSWTTVDVSSANLVAGIYTLDGLSENTTYEWQVAAWCDTSDNDNISTYVAGEDFSTPMQFPMPTSLAANNISTNSADITWTAGSTETAWQLYYTPYDYATPSSASPGDYINISTTPAYTMTGLTGNTTYYVYVRANYGEDHYSSWTDAMSFRTTVLLPYSYDFTDESEMNSWTMYNCHPTQTGRTGSESNYYFHILYSGTYNPQYLITPLFQNNSRYLLVRFEYKKQYGGDTGPYPLLNVGYSLSDKEIGSFTWPSSATVEVNSDSYQSFEYIFQVEGIKYIAIKYDKNATYSNTDIDNISFTPIDKVYTGGSEEWNYLADWTPAGLPESTDDVYINNTITIPNTCTAEANNIILGPSGSLTIADGGQLILPKTSTGVQATVKKETYAATAKDTYYYWFAISSAVANPIISSATNLTEETYDLYRYNEAATATNAQGQILYWENYKAGHADFTTLEPGRGYLYRNASDLSITMTGKINVADFNYSVTNSGGALAGFNLIGNPYSHDIYKGAGTAIPNGTDFLRTGFYYMDPTTGKWTTGTDNSTAIKPNEAIFVQTDANGNIEMTNTNASGSAKANNDNIMFKVANSQYSDEAYAWFDKGRGLNKISHRNAEVPMLYINQDGENYAIATMSDDIKTFSLNFKAMTMGKYTLSYKTKGEFNYLHVIDRFTGEDVDMLLEGEYSFVASPNDSDARFIVRLEYTSNNGTNDSSVFAYQSGNEIIVSGEGELQIFDVMGRKISTHQINGVETVNVNAHGVYIFKLNEKTQKIIIK